MESPKETSSKRSTRKSSGNQPEEKSFMRFYGLAFEMVVMNLILILGGYYLDGWLETSPIFILLGVFLSLAGTIWLLLKFSK